VRKKSASTIEALFFRREGILVWELTVRTRLRRFAGFNIYTAAVLVEPHNAIYQREYSVIPTKPYISPGQILCSALPDDDVAGDNLLAAKFLYAEAFTDAVAPILNAALTFFVSHCLKLQF
jgi:hypothetical protein